MPNNALQSDAPRPAGSGFPRSLRSLGAAERGRWAFNMTHQWAATICAFLVASTSLPPTVAAAAQRPDILARELAWVGLFNRELVEWLENENRLKQLCISPEGSEEWYAC